MAIHCVNKSLPEFIELSKKTNINPTILAAKVSLWQDQNGLDNFPNLDDLSIVYKQKAFNKGNITSDLLSTDFFFSKYGDIRIKQNFYTEAVNYLNQNYKGFYNIKKYNIKGNKGRDIFRVELVDQGELISQKSTSYKEKANKELNSIVKAFLKKLGVTVKEDSTLVGENARLEITEVGQILVKLIRIAKGEAGLDTLTEEAVHLLVEMTPDNDPQLKAMLDMIEHTQLYKETFEEYKSDEHYVNSDGSPNVNKIKREAVGKMIAQKVINKFTVKDDSPRWKKLLTLVERFLARIMKKFGVLNEFTLQEQIDKSFGLAAEKILKADVTGLSDTSLKEGVFKQKGGVKGAPTLEEKEGIISRYVKDITEQVKRLKDRLRPGKEELNRELNAEISKLKERIEKLEDGQTSDALVAYAEEDIEDIRKTLSKFQDLTIDEKRRFYFTANSYLETWKHLNKLLKFSNKAIDDRINSVSGKAISLQGELTAEYEEFYNQLFTTPAQPLAVDFFSSQIDTSALEALFLNLGINDIEVVRQIFDLLQRANFKAADTTEMDHKLIDTETEKLLAWAKKNNVKEADLWDMFTQKRADGTHTEGYVHEISQDYYDTLNAINQEINAADHKTPQRLVAIKKRNDFIKNNADVIVDEVAWAKEVDAARERYTDDNGVLDANKFSYWYNLYNPHGTGDMRYKSTFSKIVPKREKWFDKRFAKIENTPELLNFYTNVLKKIIDEKLEFLPYLPEYRANFLPELAKSTLLGFNDKAGALKSLKKGMLDVFTVRPEDNLIYSTTDPITGEVEKQVPIYMVHNRLLPDQKERDLSKVLKAFASMSNLYKYKEEVQDDVLILRALINNVFEHVQTGSGENVVSNVTNRYVRKKLNALSKTKDALDYAIDYSLYNIKKNAPDVGKAFTSVENKFGEKEARGFSFTRLFDSMITLTRRKGMGINVFASTVNLAFGVITNMVESNGGEAFKPEHANKALNKMLYTTFTGGKSKESKKILLLMDRFRILKDFADTALEGSTTVKNKIDKILFYMQEKSELFIHGQTFLAIMFNTPITDKNGKQKNLYEAYKMEGNELVWDTENFGEELYSNLSESKYQFMKNTNRIIERLHGDYNPDNPKLYNKTIIGRIMMVFRAWLPQSAYARFGKEKTIDGVTTKGRLRSFSAYFDQEGVSKMEGIGQMMGGILKEFNRQFLNFMIVPFGAKGLSYDSFSKLKAVDKANMRRNVAAMRYTLCITGLMLLLAGIDVDDEDRTTKTAIKFLLNETFRIQNDLSFFLNPSAQEVILRDIVPLGGTVADFKDVFDATIRLFNGEDTLKTGPNAGRSNWIRQFNQNIPGLNQAQKLIELADSQVN